jgi:hypothetical protein
MANRRSILTAVRNEKPKFSVPATPSSDPAPETAPKTGAGTTKPSRRNKLHIGGYFDPDDLNVIAFQKLKVDLRKSQQEMLLEALRDFVAKHEAASAFRS